MDWILAIAAGIAGVALLYYGAEFLVGGGVSAALKFKISPLVIGLTLVAFATSAPELVVSIKSSLSGHGDVALGNVIGSNICNIALILGLSALIAPIPVNRKLFKLDLPVMIGSAALLVLFYYMNQGVNRWEALLFFAGILVYTVWSICNSRREGVPENDGGDEVPMKERSLVLSLLLIAGGLIALVAGAHLFVNCAVFIARQLHVSEAVIGLTIVAVGTSLPELATSVVAAIKHEQDIAIGNVVGSNIFNILAILGVSPLCSPIVAPAISLVDLWVMLGVSVLFGVMLLSGRKLSRAEGALLLLIYGGYLAYLIF